jgi:hypothetical protein
MSLQHAIHKEISMAWVTLLLAGLFEIGFATKWFEVSPCGSRVSIEQAFAA